MRLRRRVYWLEAACKFKGGKLACRCGEGLAAFDRWMRHEGMKQPVWLTCAFVRQVREMMKLTLMD